MGLLITAKELSNQQACHVFDCSFSLTDPAAGRAQYDNGHIPGAHYADLDRDLSAEAGSEGRHPLPGREQFAERLRAFGVNRDSTIICYDQNVGAYAARLWWMIRWLGHEDVYVLDGGIQAWQAEGLPITTTSVAASRGNFAIRDPLTRVRNADELLETNSTLIDAREENRYLGLEEPIDPIAGHIPGAVCAPFIENLNDGLFQKPAELRARFKDLIPDNQFSNELICYCGSGVTATHNILALMLAGFEEPALYPGSWSGWITDPDRPIATGQ